MGLFSWRCRQCRYPIASSDHYVEPINRWMRYAIALKKDGTPLVSGLYDGYGRILGDEDDESTPLDEDGNEVHCYPHETSSSLMMPEIYHYACYLRYGAKTERGRSEYDSSQGGFTKDLPLLSVPDLHPCVDKTKDALVSLRELLHLDYVDEAADWLQQDTLAFGKLVHALAEDFVEADGAHYIYGLIDGMAAGSCIHRSILLQVAGANEE